MCLVKTESSTEYTPAEVVDIVETVGASDEAVCNFLCDNKPIRASGHEQVSSSHGQLENKCFVCFVMIRGKMVT